MKDIKNWIKRKATNDELFKLVSTIYNYNGRLEEYVFYDIEELDRLFCGMKPTDNFNVNANGFRKTMYGLESCSKWDAVKDIRNNADEVVDAIEDVIDKIDLPESLIEE